MPDRQRTKSTLSPAASRHRIRIIGGEWRGRKLEFPSIAAIRPTPDRVRETVFNWLQNDIVGARCLDLFAGSGALGMEALSRGAASVEFVDCEPRVGQYLRAMLQQLNTSLGKVHVADSLKWLATSPQPLDVVFLDPPFGADVLPRICLLLEQGGWLAPEALIYIECSSTGGLPQLPSNWAVIKSKTTGQVGYHLARRKNSS
jgi:16S rRNA (guanine966-N2)-methyltransferase